MEPRHTKRDRAMGCLLGGAIGDAWGGPWENKVGPIRFETPLRSTISDDSQLTFATCESIIEINSVDPESIASHFLAWFREGKISGIGASTLKAMRDLSAGVHWALAGRSGQYAAGNGAAMRIAPLAFMVDPAKPVDRRLLKDVCRITHNNDEAYVGALAVVIALQSTLKGIWSSEHSFLGNVVDSLPPSEVRDRIEEIISLQIPPSEIAAHFGASGYVADTVPLALACAQYIVEEPLSSVLGRAISLGGDTDTIASITGQLAGAVVGPSGISIDLLAGIEDRDYVLRIAGQFADFIGSQEEKVGQSVHT